MLSRLSRNSVWLLAARFGAQAGLALFTILLARHLGSHAFGEYAFISAVVVVGNTVTTFGTDMFLIREIAAAEDASLLPAALWLQLILSAVFIALALPISGFLGNLGADAVLAMRIYSLSLLPLAFFTVYTTALRGRQRMLAYALLNLALIALQLASIFTLIWLRGGLVDLAILLLLVQCLGAAVAARIARVRLVRLPLPASTLKQLIGLMKASASIAALAVVGILYQRLSLLLLPSLAGASVAGWFSAAARLVEAAKMGHVAAFTALYPLMAQARSTTWPDFTKSFRWPWWFLLMAASLAAAVLSAFAAPLVGLLYGSDFAGAVPLLHLLPWCLIPYSINGFLSLVFLARGRAVAILRALAIATLTLAVLTFWLVPAIGAPGAVVAALAAEIVQSVALLLEYARLSRPVSSSAARQYDLSTQP